MPETVVVFAPEQNQAGRVHPVVGQKPLDERRKGFGWGIEAAAVTDLLGLYCKPVHLIDCKVTQVFARWFLTGTAKMKDYLPQDAARACMIRRAWPPMAGGPVSVRVDGAHHQCSDGFFLHPGTPDATPCKVGAYPSTGAATALCQNNPE